MQSHRALLISLFLVVPTLLPVGDAAAGIGDLSVFSSSGGAPPNILLLLDTSGSMLKTPLGCKPGKDAGCVGATKKTLATDAIKSLVQAVNPPDGSGGFVDRARFGLGIYTKDGGRVLVPIGAGTTQAIIDWMNNADAMWAMGGNSHGFAATDMGRYLALPNQWGPLPVWGTFANEQPLTNPFDVACRQTFLVEVTDGIWKGPGTKGSRYGECPVGSGNNCYDQFLGDADGDGEPWMDDITLVLNQTDFSSSLAGTQNVITHFVGFAVDDPRFQDVADQGGGSFVLAQDGNELAAGLIQVALSIFDGIRSFSSATVPGSSLGLGNAFYNSYFLSSNAPVWEGHLEALRISSTGEILDKFLDPAVDPVTGALLDSRVPFWDAADPLKTNTSRTIYTTKSSARVTFDNSNVTSTDLDVNAPTYADYPNSGSSGVDTVAELVDAIIGYIRGKDAFDEDNDADATEMRAIVLGDIFHSTPRAIAAPTRVNITDTGFLGFFNTYRTRDRVVYAGANDGLFHAFRAGQFFTGDDASTPEVEASYYSYQDGAELFAYAPGQLLNRLKLVPQNSPRAEFFVDGPISVADAWLGDGTGTDITKTSDEWATVMMTGYREGGSGYLALDITKPGASIADPHGPYPVLLWEFTEADLGESWSEAVITRVKLRHSSLGVGDHCGRDDIDGDCREQWVAIFGGGYEADGDPNRPLDYVSDPSDVSWRDKSKAMFMVALDTGNVIAKVEYDASDAPDMKFSLPSAPAVIDRNFDGFADVVYMGDLGGQVWKWDISNVGEDSDADPFIDNWSSGVFFRTDPVTLSDGVTSHYRSFFFPPVASIVKGHLMLAFGSGERHDLGYEGDSDASIEDNNRFYVVRDPNPTGSGAFATTWTDASLTDVTDLDTDTNLADAGYRFSLAKSEKFVTEISVFAGHVIAGSYTPAPSVDLCSTASGQAFLHVFNVATGRGLFQDAADPPSEDRRTYIGGGFPTSPEVTVATNPDDDTIIVKTSEGPRVITVDAPPRSDPKGSMIYWKQQL